MAASPVVEALRWVAQKLAADSTLSAQLGGRWCEPPAPVDWQDPFVVWVQNQTPEDLMTNGSVLLMSTVYLRSLIAQRGTSKTSPFDLTAIDARLQQVLHRSSGVTGTGATIIDCIRLRPALTLPDFDRGTAAQYVQVGSEWSILVQAA